MFLISNIYIYIYIYIDRYREREDLVILWSKRTGERTGDEGCTASIVAASPEWAINSSSRLNMFNLQSKVTNTCMYVCTSMSKQMSPHVRDGKI